MKITVAIESLICGGAERQVTTLASALSKSGHDVEVLTYYRRTDGDFDSYVQLLAESGVKHVFISASSRPGRLWAIRKHLKRSQPDVVLSFLHWTNMTMELSSLPSRRWGLVVSERTSLPASSNRLRRILMRRLHGIADYVTCNSRTNHDAICRDIPWKSERVITVYNSVDLRRFSPNDEHKSNGIFRLAYVGRYDANKNHLGVVNAVAKVRRRRPDIDLQIDCYGDSLKEDSNYQSLKILVRDLGLEEIITLHGVRADIEEVYKSSHAVILASFCEGLPNSVCEAMACGKPVLMSDVCDARHLVQEGRNGFLFDPADPVSIAEAIIRLYDLPEEDHVAMGKASRESAVQMFDPDAMVAKYEEILSASSSRVPGTVKQIPFVSDTTK